MIFMMVGLTGQTCSANNGCWVEAGVSVDWRYIPTCSVMPASNNIPPSHSNPSFQRVSWSGASTDTIKRVHLDLS